MRRLLLSTLVLLLLAAVTSGCPRASDREAIVPASQSESPAAAANAKLAAESKTVADKKQDLRTAFDKKRAWAHLHQQLTYGFRVPGTKGHKACRKYLTGELLKYCDKVEQQDFSVTVRNKAIPMSNLIGRFGMDKQKRIILAAHWDTRPTADKNPSGKRNQPIAGANDGASGVAVLLELARVFHDNPPPVGVDIVLFDGEDYGPGLDMMFLGAKYFARQLSVGQVRSYNYGILLDMVGDRNLDIHPELNSELVCPKIYQVALEVSESLGIKAFKTTGAYEIYDDHLPLHERGVRMYDFIDFNYEYWHTTEDTEDKCSADSLDAVGRTVEIMVYKFPAIYTH